MNIKSILLRMENNEFLLEEEIKYVIKAYVDDVISDDEMYEFLKLIVDKGFSKEETYYMTKAMVESGSIIDLSLIDGVTADKHSTGGVGDKTTLIVLPIVASLGIKVPKMSGRSLGLTGGTIDKLESISGFNVNLSIDSLLKQVMEIGLCVEAQSKDVAIADKKIYALRDERGLVNSISLITSSIMSKKIASGSINIIIDLKVGAGAFMKSIEEAKELASYLIDTGKRFNRKVVCVLSDMSCPLGYAVGNGLEVKEVVDFFNGKYSNRLYDLCVCLSALMYSVSMNSSYDEGVLKVKDSLESGKARDKFLEWTMYQGGNINDIKLKSKKKDIISDKSGYINSIDANLIAQIVSSMGATRKKSGDIIDYAVGYISQKEVNDYINVNEVIGSAFYNKETNMISRIMECYDIKESPIETKSIIIDIIK